MKENQKELLTNLIKNEIDTRKCNINIEWLVDYLLQNGVVVLPYKVGDTLYRVYDNHFIVDDYKIDTIMIAKDHVTVFDNSGTMYDSELIGDVVFLAHEEAEKHLKRSINKNE